MTFSKFLCCPLCGGTLIREVNSLYCEAGNGRRHCYDIASAGYVNLLPPGRSGNSHTGDDAAMISARTAFLSGGYYDGISAAAAEAAARHLPQRPCISLCDAGSGEGYHTCRIASLLAEKTGNTVDMCGIDASRKGSASGTRQAKRMHVEDHVSFAVGNIFSMPILPQSVDGVFSLFAPIPAKETARILRDDGCLIVVAAAPRHLWELRCLLYDEPREGNSKGKTPDGFALLETIRFHDTVHIPDNAALQALFTMTPFYYRTPVAGRERLASCHELTVTVAADISVYRKISIEKDREHE